jgi:hypothetical protein
VDFQIGRDQILGLLVGTSFAAGLNVYATVATLGLLGRYEVFTLPSGLHMLQDWWVIGICVVLFAVEFIADKIPAFDLIWNALHTFVRVPVAALIAYAATAQMSPASQMMAAVMGGSIAFAAHGGKTAIRAGVTPSPEPFSNSLLSLGEDALAIFLTWFATEHPYITAALVVILLILLVLIVRLVIRALKSLFRGARREVSELASGVSHT